jgi:hypothetical protein
MTYLEDRVKAALEALPDDPDMIAEKLLAEGIRGVVDDGSSCPIANYLYAQVPELLEGSDGSFSVGATATWDEEEGDDWHDVDTPEPVYKFINRFDDELYPELINED